MKFPFVLILGVCSTRLKNHLNDNAPAILNENYGYASVRTVPIPL